MLVLSIKYIQYYVFTSYVVTGRGRKQHSRLDWAPGGYFGHAVAIDVLGRGASLSFVEVDSCLLFYA